MFALGIMDKLTPGGLTGGRFIAGTGEISANGANSPIGGIRAENGRVPARPAATVFPTPAANCPDTKGAVPQGMRLIKVSTLAGAARALKALQTGGSEPVLLARGCSRPGTAGVPAIPFLVRTCSKPSETDSGDRGRLAFHRRRSCAAGTPDLAAGTPDRREAG